MSSKINEKGDGMKRKLGFMLLLLILPMIVFTTQQDTTYAETVTLEGGELVDNRTLVPLRSIFEELGATVQWDQATQTITATQGKRVIKLTVGSRHTNVNGQHVVIDVPAQVNNGRTLVPLRFVSEAMGASVTWDNKTKKATISSTNKIIIVGIGSDNNSGNMQQTIENKEQDRLFKLSDGLINEAISHGEKGFTHVKSFIDYNYKLPIIEDKLNIFQPNVWIETPYFSIMRDATLTTMNYGEYTLKDGKELLNVVDKLLPFEFETFGSNVTMGNTFNFVLIQEGKVIRPEFVDGLEGMADMTANWPNNPAYTKIVIVYFNKDDINFEKSAELVFLSAGKEYSVTYGVDFSNYK